MRLDLGRVTLLASALCGVAGCATVPNTSTSGAGVTGDGTAQGCPAKLSPQASLVYQSAALDMRPDTEMSALLREKVIGLVFTDKLSASDARAAAEQAATCLEQLRTRR